MDKPNTITVDNIDYVLPSVVYDILMATVDERDQFALILDRIAVERQTSFDNLIEGYLREPRNAKNNFAHTNDHRRP